MYKSKGYRKLGRTSSHRKALLRNQNTDLIINGSIITTLEKAKELRKLTDKTITLGKKGDLSSYRRAQTFMQNTVVKGQSKMISGKKGDREVTIKAVQYLFDTVAPKYSDRNGGYTRITKLGTRRGDNAELAKIELV
jgi:large subunit ribosomal protein L17